MAGDKDSANDLYWFRWIVAGELQEEVSKKAKAGQSDSPPPIQIILETADWAIPLLFWLTQNRRDSIKKYARTRWAWPGYFHLLKREQRKYESLLPKFNKTGTKITAESPIELGHDLALQLNANLTKGDFLFIVAANAIRRLIQTREPIDFWQSHSWLWFPGLHPPLAKLKKDRYQSEANKFLKSLGKFSRRNWSKWKPVFEMFLTFEYGPPDLKFGLITKSWRSNLHICLQHGLEIQWFENYKKSNPMTVIEETKWLEDLKTQSDFYKTHIVLQEIDRPEIREIIDRRKTNRGKWIELRDELLKRIYNLARPE